jgi:hypothetical protein
VANIMKNCTVSVLQEEYGNGGKYDVAEPLAIL